MMRCSWEAGDVMMTDPSVMTMELDPAESAMRLM